MVLINMDSSYIRLEPMKNRHSTEIIATYQIMIDRLALQVQLYLHLRHEMVPQMQWEVWIASA